MEPKARFEMYCPKCNQVFEERSRRFCPSDGTRLVSEQFTNISGRTGVFSNLFPQIGPLSDPSRKTAASAGNLNQPEDDLLDLVESEVPDEITFDLLDDPAPAEPLERPADRSESAHNPAEERVSDQRAVIAKELPLSFADLGERTNDLVAAQTFDPEDPLRFVGRRVKGRFLVTDYRGESGAGHLFFGEDKLHDDRLVTIKVYNDDKDEIVNSILVEEAVSLSHFAHPHVARLIDSGEFFDNRRYVVVERFDELSVADLLAIHGRLDPQRAATLIRQISNGLSDAHHEGLLHRNIVPANIIIDRSSDGPEKAILVGMGLSDGTPDEDTAFYRAPEVLEGRLATISSDIYSLGVVAFEMLTGDVPFKGDTVKALVRAQRSIRPQLPEVGGSALPPLAESVLSRAMSPEPSKRFPSARDFGEALHTALIEAVPEFPRSHRDELSDLPADRSEVHSESSREAAVQPRREVVLKPIAGAPAAGNDPAWTRRSPEPPEVGSRRVKLIAAVGIPVLLTLLGIGWYFLVKTPVDPTLTSMQDVTDPSQITLTVPNTNSDIEVPPLPRTIPQPPGTNFYQNTKQNLKGDLLLNFVGFTLYYPKDWKVNGPQVRENVNSRGKFLDISRENDEGMIKEQMSVSYYPSRGTFREDSDRFPQLVKESNETLKKLLAGYQLVSEGEIRINGGWRAYEMKFTAEGRSAGGQNITVWGRRIFMPAARPGVRAGFEITLLATSFSDDVKSVDDVGVKGELAKILETFEPSQNF